MLVKAETSPLQIWICGIFNPDCVEQVQHISQYTDYDMHTNELAFFTIDNVVEGLVGREPSCPVSTLPAELCNAFMPRGNSIFVSACVE